MASDPTPEQYALGLPVRVRHVFLARRPCPSDMRVEYAWYGGAGLEAMEALRQGSLREVLYHPGGGRVVCSFCGVERER